MSFFRNLFAWRPGAANAAATLAPPPSARTPPARPAPAEAASETAKPAAPREDCIPLPLKAITDLFPPALMPALRKQPSEHVEVYIPRDIIRPQLAAGAVRITFAQLRAATPGIFFHPDGAPGDAKLLLPLEAVLRGMMPSRREDQRLPSIPVNIPSIFSKSGQTQARPGRGGSAEPWYSQRRPTYDGPPQPDSSAVPAPPANGTKTAPPQPALPSVPVAPAPPVAVAAPLIPTAPPAAAPAGYVAIPLAVVLPALPTEIRHALYGCDPSAESFVIPLTEFETRMPSGKLVFKWSELRGWCRAEAFASTAEDIDVELPLAPVVPLFLAARKTPDKRKKIEIDARIPDVFGKSNIPTAVPAPAPASTPVPAPAPAAPAAPPMRLEQAASPPPPPIALQPPAADPAEIVRSIRALDGVAGAFLATADGLLIAGEVPDANGNILAAFAPTIFSQLTKYTDLAQLGIPESIDVHLSTATVHVRKAGKLYMGVLIPHGRPIPLDALARISTALQPHAS